MKIGIIGLAAAGKTTLFNALTGGAASTGGYGAARVNIGAAHVADPRVGALSKVFKPKKTTYAAVNFVDAGVGDGGAAKNAEAIPQALEGADALLVVVRAFQDAGVPHPRESIDPARDLVDVRIDLLLRDLSVVERRRERLEKLVRVKKDPAEAAEFALLTKIQETLEDGRPVRSLEMSDEEERSVKGFGFLSAKPLLVVVNVGEEQSGDAFGELDGETPVALAARLEEELAQLPGEEQAEFLADYDLESSALDKVIRASFSLLDLRCFFTVSGEEVRAWPVRAGTVALHAAGTIHSDLERGFIRAEVVTYADFMAAGSLSAARDRGTLRLEGKDYVVKDGDIFHVRFNV
ncbi:redox-regulated ATPase YchF [Achromobacter marplatensis]|uniref:redox-regulated ATPase YchF n=1 Tax=Achromobacter marplatensis TaxID=470868 RepID=UPI003D04291B